MSDQNQIQQGDNSTSCSNHSNSCSEISAIGQEEAFERDNSIPLNSRAPEVPTEPISIETQLEMEAAEKSIFSKIKKFSAKTKSYTPDDLSVGSLNWHNDYMKEIRTV